MARIDDLLDELADSLPNAASTASLLAVLRAIRDEQAEIRAAFLAGTATPRIRRLADVEKDAVLSALATTGGNVAAAARALDVGQATVYRRLKEWRVKTSTSA